MWVRQGLNMLQNEEVNWLQILSKICILHHEPGLALWYMGKGCINKRDRSPEVPIGINNEFRIILKSQSLRNRRLNSNMPIKILAPMC